MPTISMRESTGAQGWLPFRLDYNPTARQSSLWIPINPGTDSFFAMSMINVILKERLYNAEFIKEQTDLPLLVKKSDGMLLRKSDMVKGGSSQVFYFF